MLGRKVCQRNKSSGKYWDDDRERAKVNVSSPQKKVGGAISRLSLRLKEGLDRGLQWEDDATPAGALRVRVDSNFDGGMRYVIGGAGLV